MNLRYSRLGATALGLFLAAATAGAQVDINRVAFDLQTGPAGNLGAPTTFAEGVVGPISPFNNATLATVDASDEVLFSDIYAMTGENGGCEAQSVDITMEASPLVGPGNTITLAASSFVPDVLCGADPNIPWRFGVCALFTDKEWRANQTLGFTAGQVTPSGTIRLTTTVSVVSSCFPFVEVATYTSFLEVGAVPFPVELVRLSAKPVGDANEVTWTSARETAVRGFHVERSADGRAFSAAAFLDAVASDRERESLTEYRYVDAVAGRSDATYYRLRVEDLDGSTEYSDVVAVTRAGAGGKYGPGLTLAPNPARDYVQVGIAGAPGAGSAPDRTLTLTDAAGRVVRRRTVTGADAVSLRVDVAGLPAGLYLVTAAGEGGRVTERLFVK